MQIRDAWQQAQMHAVDMCHASQVPRRLCVLLGTQAQSHALVQCIRRAMSFHVLY